MEKNNQISCAVLAGGMARRMGRQNKAFMRVCGRTLLDRVRDAVSPHASQTFLITSDPLAFVETDLAAFADIFQVQSPLAGIHTALYHATTSHVLMVPCDMPFLAAGALETLFSQWEPEFDIVVPQTKEGLEPLCSIYSVKCIKPIAHKLTTGRLKVSSFFSQMRVRKVPEKMFREKDPGLLSFFNVNGPQDLEKAEQLALKHNL